MKHRTSSPQLCGQPTVLTLTQSTTRFWGSCRSVYTVARFVNRDVDQLKSGNISTKWSSIKRSGSGVHVLELAFEHTVGILNTEFRCAEVLPFARTHTWQSITPVPIGHSCIWVTLLNLLQLLQMLTNFTEIWWLICRLTSQCWRRICLKSDVVCQCYSNVYKVTVFSWTRCISTPSKCTRTFLPPLYSRTPFCLRRGHWNRATWQRGTRSNRGVRARLNRGGAEQSIVANDGSRTKMCKSVKYSTTYDAFHPPQDSISRSPTWKQPWTNDVVAHNRCWQRLPPKPTLQ